MEDDKFLETLIEKLEKKDITEWKRDATTKWMGYDKVEIISYNTELEGKSGKYSVKITDTKTRARWDPDSSFQMTVFSHDDFAHIDFSGSPIRNVFEKVTKSYQQYIEEKSAKDQMDEENKRKAMRRRLENDFGE